VEAQNSAMPTLTTIMFFALAALALLVVPGPAVLYIVTRSVESGRRVGLASVAGVHVGTVVHVLAAAAGLSALLVSSATAFALVKYAGAAYLVVLGVRRLLERHDAVTPEPAPTSPRRAFAQGVVVNVLNPKTALFFLAFLPPFLDPRRGPVFVQVLVLGLTFIAIGLLSDSAYALAAALLAGRWRAVRVGRRVSGLVYIGLGLVAAVTPRAARTG
jgi:threonine/homoserine/homoserine lactone efflux protein